MVLVGWLEAQVPFRVYDCPVELVTVAVQVVSQHLVPVHVFPLGHVQVELTVPPQPSDAEIGPQALGGQVGAGLGLQVHETVVTQLGQLVHWGAVVGQPPVEGHVLAADRAAEHASRRRASTAWVEAAMLAAEGERDAGSVELRGRN
jgi:hypothetical protein